MYRTPAILLIDRPATANGNFWYFLFIESNISIKLFAFCLINWRENRKRKKETVGLLTVYAKR